MASTPLATAWIAVQAASAKEKSAALALENEELQRRSPRARQGLVAQHDAALDELEAALKVLLALAVKRSSVGRELKQSDLASLPR
jgi:hypothetical protein